MKWPFPRLILTFPYSVWLNLTGVFLTSGAYWMTWPFIVVILHQNYHLDTVTIGAFLSASVIVATLSGVYIGHLSDKVGRRAVVLSGGLLGTMAFMILAYSNNITLYVLGIISVGLSKAILDPLSKAIFGDLLTAQKQRALALHCRYFIVNLSAAVGPLVGAYFGLSAKKETFIITEITFFIYSVLLFYALRHHSQTDSKTSTNTISFKHTIGILISDHAFLVLIVANILLWIVFVQFEVSIAQYFTMLKLPNLVRFISAIVITNAASIILLQFLLLKWLENVKVSRRITVGIVILALSQLMFAFSPTSNEIYWIISTIVFSIGEVILVPNLNVQIDQMAPEHLRGSYFSATFLYRIGSGAYLGGVLLHMVGGMGLFIIMFFVSLVIMVLYILSAKLKRPTPA